MKTFYLKDSSYTHAWGMVKKSTLKYVWNHFGLQLVCFLPTTTTMLQIFKDFVEKKISEMKLRQEILVYVKRINTVPTTEK